MTDSSGAAVPNATVTITNIGTNVSETTKTNESGNYNQTRLIPGTYRVKVEASSFKSAIIETVVVNVDTSSTVNVTLQAGQVTEQITITADAPLLKTDRADVATTFESRQISDLPILDRNFTKFILLTPGTQQLGWQHAASENPQGSMQTMVNGQHFSGTGYQLDGTENRDPILGIIVINPNFEAIGETKITSQNYDAEFGRLSPAWFRSRPNRARTICMARSSCSARTTCCRRAIPSRSFRGISRRANSSRHAAQSVRRRHRRANRQGSLLLLRQLRGIRAQDRRLAADRADGGGSRRQPERVSACAIFDPVNAAGARSARQPRRVHRRIIPTARLSQQALTAD